jgi:hypothetical protein
MPLAVLIAHQSQPGLVNERGGLKRLTRRFQRHLGRRQSAQLIIDHRQEFLCGFGVALRQGFENVRDVVFDDGGVSNHRQQIKLKNLKGSRRLRE